MAAPSSRLQLDTDSTGHQRTDRLMQAIQSGDVAAVEVVLAGDVDVNASTSTGTTPLISAAEYGQLEIVRSLLRRGAAIDTPRSDGFTALALAVFFGHGEVVRELLASGANAKAKGRSGTSLEMWALVRGFVDLADLLKSAGEQGGNVTPRMTQISESTTSPATIQSTTVAGQDDNLDETTLIGPRANLVTNNSHFRNTLVIEETTQPRSVELDEKAAVIKAERAVDISVPFSPFESLVDRLGMSWPRAAAALLLVTILSAGVTLTTLKALKHKPPASQSKAAVAESSSAKPVQVPELAVKPIPSSPEQTTGSVSNVSDERSTEGTYSPSANHVFSSSANVIPSYQPATANNSEVKESLNRATPSYVNEQRKGLRAKRRQDEIIIASDNHDPSAEANAQAPVTIPPKAPTTQTRSLKAIGDAPSLSTEPIKGSSTKRKVIQWP